MASQSDRYTNIVSRTYFVQQNEKPSTKAEAIKHNRVACIRILNVWHSHFFAVFVRVCVSVETIRSLIHKHSHCIACVFVVKFIIMTVRSDFLMLELLLFWHRRNCSRTTRRRGSSLGYRKLSWADARIYLLFLF